MNGAPADSARAHVLVVEDSSVFREMQGLLLRQAGYAVSGHEHPQTALAAARERKFDLVIIDYELPEMNGQQFMNELRKILPDIAVIFVSGSLTLQLAIQLGREGVAGIFNKPVNPKTLLEKINETITRTGSREAALPGKGSGSPLPGAGRTNSGSPVPTAPAPLAEPTAGEFAYTPRHFPGRSDAFREFTHRLWRVRDFRAALLLQGESGTPFELVARDLAAISVFRNGPVMVCPAASFETGHLIEVLAPTLLATDAGTLIVTGVESLTPAQQKILQALIGSRDMFLPFARRFRLVLAATGHLSDLADSGAFDETLYYKASSLSLDIPSLRALRGDLLLHARQLLDQHAAALDVQSPALTTAAAAWLEAQDWPGNYAALSATLQLAVASARDSELSVPALESARAQACAETGELTAGAAFAVATTAPARSCVPIAIEDTLPPFALRSAPAPARTPVAPTPIVAVTLTDPAPSPAAPKRNGGGESARPSGLTARSVFRPASGAYDFSKRLAESLTLAETATAS